MIVGSRLGTDGVKDAVIWGTLGQVRGDPTLLSRDAAWMIRDRYERWREAQESKL
jgi:hypothetical protein